MYILTGTVCMITGTVHVYVLLPYIYTNCYCTMYTKYYVQFILTVTVHVCIPTITEQCILTVTVHVY